MAQIYFHQVIAVGAVAVQHFVWTVRSQKSLNYIFWQRGGKREEQIVYMYDFNHVGKWQEKEVF